MLTLSWPEFLEEKGLREDVSNGSRYEFYFSADMVRSGLLYYVSGNTLNQVARRNQHSNCRCWIELKRDNLDPFELLRSMVSWLSQRTDVVHHAWAAYDLKTSYGMKKHKLPDMPRPVLP